MPSGFQQRWLGKVLGKLVGVGAGGLTAYTATGGAVNVSPNDLAAGAGGGLMNGTASTVAKSILGQGITKLSSVGATNYDLGAPVARRRALVYTDAIGDGARKISSTLAGATFVSSLASAAFLNLSTTAPNVVGLTGLSTALWLIDRNIGSVTVTTA